MTKICADCVKEVDSNDRSEADFLFVRGEGLVWQHIGCQPIKKNKRGKP
jgi:hypothetical protein